MLHYIGRIEEVRLLLKDNRVNLIRTIKLTLPNSRGRNSVSPIKFTSDIHYKIIKLLVSSNYILLSKYTDFKILDLIIKIYFKV